MNRYLLAGDSRQLNAIGETQRELRQRAGRVRELNSLVDLEDSWYVNYAEPLIHARQQFDADTGTIVQMLALHHQLSAEQQQNRSQIIAIESANKSDAEKLRNEMGLRNVTALRETA